MQRFQILQQSELIICVIFHELLMLPNACHCWGRIWIKGSFLLKYDFNAKLNKNAAIFFFMSFSQRHISCKVKNLAHFKKECGKEEMKCVRVAITLLSVWSQFYIRDVLHIIRILLYQVEIIIQMKFRKSYIAN